MNIYDWKIEYSIAKMLTQPLAERQQKETLKRE